MPGVERPITVARSGFKLSGGDPDVADPPPELGRRHRRRPRRRRLQRRRDRRAARGRHLNTKTTLSDEERLQKASDWWSTGIIDIEPGKIAVRGYPIQELIGTLRFPDMIWLMLRGEVPEAAQSRLLEAALVAAVDHGPHAPSIAIARMAVTCGLPLNGAMASAINALDDVHGGAGQQCMELFDAVAAAAGDAEASADVIAAELERFSAAHGKIIPGFGHRSARRRSARGAPARAGARGRAGRRRARCRYPGASRAMA